MFKAKSTTKPLKFRKGDRAKVVGGVYYRAYTEIFVTVKVDVSSSGFVPITFDSPQTPRGSSYSKEATNLHTQSLKRVETEKTEDPEVTTGRLSIAVLDTVTLDSVDIDERTKVAIHNLCNKFRRVGIGADSAQIAALVHIGMRE